jgi:hypothetical protein
MLAQREDLVRLAVGLVALAAAAPAAADGRRAG